MPGTLRHLVLLLAVTRAAATAQVPKPPPPLAQFISQRVNVMPVQLLKPDTGALVVTANWAAFRKELDDSIGAAIAQRGVNRTWSYAADVARAARRNAAYVSDPYSLGAQQLRGVLIKAGDRIPDLLASNLRTHIAIGDTRYALIPLEIMFVHKGVEQHAVLRLVLVDGRGALFMWQGEVTSDAVQKLTPAVVSSLAARVADLVVAP